MMAAETNQPLAGGVAVEDPVETDWLAFAYVAGELDGAELSEFEVRLAEGEIEACEAVVRAVELVGAVSAPSRPVVVGQRVSGNPDRRAEGWRLVVTSAVCLMLVVALSIRSGDQVPNEPGSDIVADQGFVDGLLLSTWAGGTDSEPDEMRGAAGSEAEMAASELVVPEWMIAAMALPEEMNGGHDE